MALTLLRSLAFSGLVVLALGLPQTSAQGLCLPIQMSSSADSIEISGTAPPDDGVCFSLKTRANQVVSVSVVQGRNVIFSIPGVVEVVDEYQFTARAASYEIMVGQLMRSITEEPFRLRISVGGG